MSRLAIDMGGTWLRYELIGEKEECGKLPSAETELHQFLVSMLVSHPDIDAVAVSFAGQVHEGTILSAPNIKFAEPEIQNYIQTRFGVHFKIENDLNCAAFAEAVYWNEKELVALYAGTGLGCGIVSKGEILHGWRSLAGEVGHIPFKKAPFSCGCGKDNCLELYASGSGIKRWMDYLGCDIQPDLKKLRIHERVECKDIAKTFDEALLRAAATVVTLLNPKILVFGGGVIRHNPEVVEYIKDNIHTYALADSCKGLRIETSRIEDASLEGAKLLLDTI